jgi:hypothetical protein
MEIVQAQNHLLFGGANPTCRVHAVLGATINLIYTRRRDKSYLKTAEP